MISIYEFVAMAIDFEGAITVTRTIRNSGNYSYAPRVDIYNSSKLLIYHFKNRVGFGYIPEPRNRENCALSYQWRLKMKSIGQYLPLIEPYLVLKRGQAQLAIELFTLLRDKRENIKSGVPGRLAFDLAYSKEVRDRFNEIYYEATVLNLKAKYKEPELTDQEKLLREFRKNRSR